ncbi:ABC transporter substrate-binding protein [candidate division WOR-3 bacterium]|uniref:ABC transporter substrate-binding protein n=1 Tax=candidate division WOR-3 bacterium TaxID=2052148 RepID=A0A9D5K916_UNCW3|nr:ABC transporter substrate-binding protein [candidate division WOR-3 bacterium]MBD3363814.1 ABC transporter substrate-binding protein [candidate division WOR-3 bacterium]
MKTAKILVISVILISFLPGCRWYIFNRQKYEQEALAVFERAEENYKKGTYTDAVEECSRIIINYPRSQLVDDAYYLASLSFAKEKDWTHAVGAAQKLEKEYPKSPLVAKSRIILAEGYEHLKLYPQALTAYIEVYLSTNNTVERSKAETRAKNLLGREKDYNVLTDLYKKFSDTEAAEWLLYFLASKAYEVEDFERSERYFAELRQRFPHSPYIDMIGGREISSAVLKGEFFLGLLLPLTGSFSEFGNKVKQGVELAHKLEGKNTIYIEVYDTHSDPGEAAKGIQHLISRGAKAIIGPLTSAEVNATAKIAGQAGLTMISPTSTDPNLLYLNNCLFQLNSYAEEEAREIARFAVRKDYMNFGILYPQTEQGKNLADVFATTVKAEGGKVLYSRQLSDTVVNMKQTFLEIRHKGAQAIFLPFDHHQLLSVVPQIAYYRMKVAMLGIDDFADREILRRGGTPFEGVWFAATPGKLASDLALNSFFNQYRRVYEGQPDWAVTLGYDAYMFLYEALSEGKNLSLCEAMRMLDDRRGLLGRLLYLTDPDNPAIRIYTIYKNEIKEIK